MTNRISIILTAAALTAGTTHLLAEGSTLARPATPYMGGAVELVEAPNSAIADKRILDGIEKAAWLEAIRTVSDKPIRAIRTGSFATSPMATSM